MGIFSSKKKIYVSSVAYNMAGEYKDRASYLKTTVVGAVLRSSPRNSIGSAITGSMLNGSYNTQRNLLRWAKANYKEGLPKAYFGDTASLDISAINEYLYEIHGSNLINAESALAGSAQAYWWAYQWILINYPNLLPEEWSYDLLSNSPSSSVVVIELVDGTKHNVFMQDFDPAGYYAYIRYTPLEWKTGVENPEDDPEYLNILPPQITIYKYGTGNPIMEGTRPPIESLGGEFMPFMPLRIDNEFINEGSYKDKYYNKASKFYKKASGGEKITKLIDTVGENEKLDDIDYAFVQYGVALNTKTKSCKRYLFEFFRTLMDRQKVSTETFEKWIVDNDKALVLYREIQDLYIQVTQSDGGGSDGGGSNNRLLIDALPSFVVARESDTPRAEYNKKLQEWGDINPGNIPYNTISQVSDWLPVEYQLSHHWIACQQSLLTGILNPNHDVGDVWIEEEPYLIIPQPTIVTRRSGGGDSEIVFDASEEWVPVFYIIRQVSATVAQRIKVTGFTQQNVVYKGKDIWVDSAEALKDPEESSLIVPMHMPTLKRISMKDRNQCCVENLYILFNCYEVVKVRWYQRGIFKVVFAVAIAVLSVFLPPLGGAIGLFGSSLGVGIALGFSGITAAIIGAAVNALAGMLLATLLQKVTGDLFEGLLGSVIGSLLSVFLTSSFNSVFNGGGIAIEWGNLIKVDNLIKLTDSISQGYSSYVQSSIQGLQQSSQEYIDWASEEVRNIEKLYKDVLQVGNTLINPLMFTEGATTSVESENSYLSRTLMSGSDIAGLSIDMLTNFSELNLTLPDAYG